MLHCSLSCYRSSQRQVERRHCFVETVQKKCINCNDYNKLDVIGDGCPIPSFFHGIFQQSSPVVWSQILDFKGDPSVPNYFQKLIPAYVFSAVHFFCD